MENDEPKKLSTDDSGSFFSDALKIITPTVLFPLWLLIWHAIEPNVFTFHWNYIEFKFSKVLQVLHTIWLWGFYAFYLGVIIVICISVFSSRKK